MIKKIKERRWEKALAPNGNHHTHQLGTGITAIRWIKK